ncbi:MAG: TIGR02281 family clan AA aspartic protease [Alphaproteobacteria bacterium]|nr:TIGR02281 family clan AA aspartic protease [Alphaproteobacteria bacterium]
MAEAIHMAGLVDFLRAQPLLALAIVAIFVTVAGGMVRRTVPLLGRLLQGAGNLGLVAALLLTIGQVARLTTTSDFAQPQLGMPEQSVSGGETRIPMSRDGHFWLTATINGAPARFLIDTGATLTAISEQTALDTRVHSKSLRQTINMKTANGAIRAKLATIEELRLGNVVARDLDTVVAPGLGETNVIGMNLLSRLKGWRVEDNTLILVPNHPQQTVQN